MKGCLPPKVEKSFCIKDHLPSKVVLLVGGQFLSQHFKSKPPTKPRAFKKFLVGRWVVEVAESDFSVKL